MTTFYRTTIVNGQTIFYREAGDVERPTIILLHGFPASSFMFRHLIELISGSFHVIAPDYPGFGHSDAPRVEDFTYSFEHLTDIIEGFTDAIGVSSYALYMQDFGGPVGFRLATRHPDRITFLVVQNANAYDEGLPDSFWAPLRQMWQDPSNDNRAAIRAGGMSDAALEWNYTHGTVDAEKIDPDSWLLQRALLDRPGNRDAMLELLYDYRTNPPLYPVWQSYFRDHRPPTLIVWGKGDEIFPESGAHPFLRDLPDADVTILDAGHFALEDHATVISDHILRFAAAHAATIAR